MASIPEQDPLRSLIVEDASVINREKLAKFLKDYVGLSADGSMSFLPAFNALDNRKKVETVLAAAKARSLLFDYPDGVRAADIIALDIIPLGSVKSSLKSLFDSRKIKKDSVGRYVLPGYRITELTN